MKVLFFLTILIILSLVVSNFLNISYYEAAALVSLGALAGHMGS